MPKLCMIPGCERPHDCHGYCGMHNHRWQRHGDPLWTPLTDIERYEAKVDRLSTPTDCHPWIAGCFDSGYGHFVTRKTNKWDGRAHRWGYEYYIGPIAGEMEVCHTCDNPPCQNRNHWFLGTSAENSADMVAKGRQNTNRGQDCGRTTTLTDEMVLEIRRRYAVGGRPYVGGTITQQALADEFGVTRPSISMIVNRKTWTHLP